MYSTNESIQLRGDTFFLNLRFLLIVCVFVGNAIEPLISNQEVIHSLYMWIFTFHMPLFVFVTGYFAKSNLFGEAGRKLLLQIGVQYVIFQTLYSLLDVTIFQVDNIHHSFFAPYLLLWFLASHICWRLLLIGMHKCTPAQQLAISVALGVMVGYLQVDGVWLSISRTFVFLPFFIAGYHFSFAKFEKWLTTNMKRVAIAGSSVLFIVLLYIGDRLAPGWLYGNMTYGQLGEFGLASGVYRLMIYVLQIVSGMAFLGFVPKVASMLTEYGKRTLYVFLLHGFIIRLAAVTPIYSWIRHEMSSVLIIVGAILLTVVLSQPFIKRWTSPLIEPTVQWTLVKRAQNMVDFRDSH